MAKALGRRKKGKLKQLEDALEEDPAFTEQFEKRPEGQIVPGEIPEQKRERQPEQQPQSNIKLEECLKINHPGLEGAVYCNNPNYLLVYNTIRLNSKVYELTDANTANVFCDLVKRFRRGVAGFPSKSRMSFAAADGNNIHFYRFKRGKFVKEVVHFTKKFEYGKDIRQLAFSNDGKYMTAGYSKGNDFSVFSIGGWWNTKLTHYLEGKCYSPCKKVLFTEGYRLMKNQGTDFIMSVPIDQRMGLTDDFEFMIGMHITDFSIFEDRIAWISNDNLYMREREGTFVPCVVKLPNYCKSVDFSPDGKHIAVACADENVYVYEVNDN